MQKGLSMERKEELKKIFENIDDEQKKLVDRLLDEVVFLEEQMAELKKLPFIRNHPKDMSLQKPTAAAKLYKECNQSYMNAIRILLGLLNKVDESAQSELLKLLKEYE